MHNIRMEGDCGSGYHADASIRVILERDSDPITFWDRNLLGDWYYSHTRYTLGTIRVQGVTEFYKAVLGDRKFGAILAEVAAGPRGLCQQWVSAAMMAEIEKKGVCIPLYLYDHSGQTVSTTSFMGRAQHARWDSGQVGYIFASNDQVKQFFCASRMTKKLRARAKEVIEAQVEELDHYIQGNVWEWSVDVVSDSEDYHKSYSDIVGELDEVIRHINGCLEHLNIKVEV